MVLAVVGLAIVVAVAIVLLLANEPSEPEAPCEPGVPCLLARDPDTLSLGKTWVSRDLGYSFEYPTLPHRVQLRRPERPARYQDHLRLRDPDLGHRRARGRLVGRRARDRAAGRVEPAGARPQRRRRLPRPHHGARPRLPAWRRWRVHAARSTPPPAPAARPTSRSSPPETAGRTSSSRSSSPARSSTTTASSPLRNATGVLIVNTLRYR